MRKTSLLNRLLSLALCLCMVLSLLPASALTAFAADAVSYIDRSYDGSKVISTEKTVTDYTTVTSGTTNWSDGWYVVSESVTISDSIYVSGTVHLILCDGVTLNANNGINVVSDNALYIYAQSSSDNMGSLSATHSEVRYMAGIGGFDEESAGTITINGGNVTAKGAEKGAGIGGGAAGSGGSVTINGGTVTATGGYNGAGIGGGAAGSGGSVTINGGTVTANGGRRGAGIGGGMDGADGGSVTINGGMVTANGADYGAGIGGGNKGSGGNIAINGGMVTANGADYGAGIGGGNEGSGGNIAINGGTVTATGGSTGAGIGGGMDGSGGSVTINGGTVTANGGSYGSQSGAGIGGGVWGSGGDVKITGGNIKATAGSSSAEAIGKGSSGTSSGTIKDANGNDVALTTIVLDSAVADTAISAVFGVNYGVNDVKTLDTNKLYFYLPSGSAPTYFTVGDTIYCGAAGDNNYSTTTHTPGKDCTADGDVHYRTCTVCGSACGRAEHSGGEADCLNKGICVVCGDDYLDIVPDNHASEETYIDYIDDTNHGLYHTCCQALIEQIAHTPAEGQEATCVGVATCAECGIAYGGNDTTNHTSGETKYISNGNGTHILTHVCCGNPAAAPESHKVTYTVNGELTIDAVCKDCGATGSATLIPTGGGTYNGYVFASSYSATGILEGWNAFAKPVITGCCEGGCKTVGTHTVTMTLGDASVSAQFTITPKTLTINLVEANYKSYDGTSDLDIYSVSMDGVVVYDAGDYDGEWDDVRDDVQLVRENMVYIFDGIVPGYYDTVNVSGVTITGSDAANYVIAESFEDVPLLDSDGYDFQIHNEMIWINAHDQLLTGDQEIDQNGYSIDGLEEQFTIEGITLYDNGYSQIAIDPYSISIYLDGEDVTEYFDILTYPGNLSRVCEGHEYDANGFCATGECSSYEAAVRVDEVDEWGSEVTYYDIYNAGQLYWFAEQVNTYGNNYINGRLMADITVNEDLTAENLRIWTPIGKDWPTYCGMFKGNDYTVSGLYVCDPEMDYVGLFGGTDYNNSISNIHLTNSYFEGDSRVGGLFGYAGSNISGCTVSDSVTVKGNSYLGGIAGDSASGELNNSWSAATVTANENGYSYGGLVGNNCLSINNCYTTESSLVGSNRASYGGSLNNSYYLSEEETEDGGKTAAQFASGEVAYLLQSGIVGEEVYDEATGEYVTGEPAHIWGQTIGTDGYPVLGGEKVYQVTNCVGGTAYSNTDASGQHADADNSGRCDGCDMLMQPAKLCFASVSLKGSIAINYYMLLSDEVIADSTAYMQFTMADGEIIQIPVSEGVATDLNGETYYKFTCAVAAKEMTDVVLSQFFYDGGSTTEFSYTVKTYADYIIANSANANEVALAKAMLNYGAAAQLDFGYNTDDLANADLEAPDYSGVSIEGFTSVSGQGTELATFYSASLLLKSETTLRFFFTGSITATYNGQELEVKERNGLYYVDVVGIAAKDLDEDVTITINDGVSSADVTYNPMAYCTVVQNDTTGTADQAMKDLVAALYLYNQAANTYFEEN